MKKIKLFLPLIFLSISFSQIELEGIVFNDRNNNQVMDIGEPGIGDQRISNGLEIVLTDEKGRFTINSDNNDVIFIIKNPKWDIPINQYGIPQFYYNVRSQPSPGYLKYDAFDKPISAKTLYFPLVQSNHNREFNAIISGDPQPRDSTEIDYFRDEIIAQMLLEENISFYVPLGDIMYDDLDLYPYYLEQVGSLGIPVWHVFGNHDLNYLAKNDSESHQTWNKYLGPDYYSFEYGNVHFIALNTVYYEGWNTDENKRGKYLGKLNAKQLTWLENDLKYVPSKFQIVLLSHIPIISDVYRGRSVELTNRDELFELIKKRKHLLALSGHMHFIENMLLNSEHGWNYKTRFQNICLGAACGAWWYGPLQENGTPYGYHYDGTPNGYFLFDFKRKSYNYDFRTSINQPQKSFRISTPEGRIRSSIADTTKIIVNIFYGSKETKVNATLDGKDIYLKKQFHAEDPFINRLISNYPDRYPKMENMPINNHMWASPMGKLSKGQHILEVTVLNDNGIKEKQVRIFEVY